MQRFLYSHSLIKKEKSFCQFPILYVREEKPVNCVINVAAIKVYGFQNTL